MRTWPAHRLAALAGFSTVVLFVVGNLIAGESPPKFDDSPQEIAAYFTDHRRAILVGSILYGALAPIFITFFVLLARTIRSRGQSDLAAIAVTGGAVVLALGAIGDAVGFAMTRTAPGNPDLTRGLYELSGYVYGRLFWVGLALVVPVGLAAWRGALPQWQAWISGLAAVLFGLAGISVKAGGAFSPTDIFSLLGFLGLLVWVLGASVALWRLEAPATMPAAAQTPV